MAAGALAFVGCGDDSASDPRGDTDGNGTGASDQDDDEADDEETSAPETEGTGLGTSDTFDPTGAGGTTGGGEGGSDTEDESPEAGCEEIDCGPAGSCEVDDQGPYCSCDDLEGVPQISTGLGCLPCTDPGDSYNANIVSSLVSVFTTLDGAEPPRNHRDDARIVLRSRDSGDEVRLGNTHSVEFTQTVVPGNYDLFYESDTVGPRMPVNRRALLGTMYVDNDTPLELDIPVVSVVPKITINGAAPPNNPSIYGQVFLVNPFTGDEALLANTFNAGDEEPRPVNVIPGTYDVHYRVVKEGAGVPSNTDVRVMEQVGVSAGGEGEEGFGLEIEIPLIEVEGAIQIGGAMPPNDSTQLGQLELVDRVTGAATYLGQTSDQSYAIGLVPGTYEVFYRGIVPGPEVPGNTRAKLPDLIVGPDKGERLDVNIPVRTIGGTVFLEGVDDPTVAGNANIFLRSEDGEDSVLIGDTLSGLYGGLIVDGKYDVRISQVTAGDAVPVNTNGLLIEGVGADSLPSEIRVTPQTVGGSFFVGGGQPPQSAYDDGRLYLHDPDSGDTALLGYTRSVLYDTKIIPGNYEVVFSAEFSDGNVPLNKFAVVEPLSTWPDDMGSARDVTVSRSRMFGTVQLNGSNPTASPGLGALYLESHEDDPIYLGHTGNSMFERALVPDRYLVRYRAVPTPDGALARELPMNSNAPIACIEFPPPTNEE